MSAHEHTHSVNPDGTVWCNRPELHHLSPQRKAELANTPGSVYYRNTPPDDDDFWQWCALCTQWHRHGPCF